MEARAPRVGHKKSRAGCSQCKRRHVKCDEEAPCANCVRHGVACSLAGGPLVKREDTNPGRSTSTSPATVSRTTSQENTRRGTLTTSTSASGSIVDSPAYASPYTVLTGLIDRPMPGQDENWMLDLQLMNHYSTHTQDILAEHHSSAEIHRIWREEIPKVAFGSDYCMHALLGFSALHKAHMEPYNAPMLQTCAVDHLDRALVFYREHGHPTTPENANAKFAFTWLVALFAYAVPPSVPAIDAIGELILLVKGIDTVLAETWFWVSEGPFAPILAAGPHGPIILPSEGHDLPEGMDFGLSHLDYMLGMEPMLPGDARTCALVLGELKQVYGSVLRQQGQSSVATILCFPKQDAAAFSALIKRRVPQALVILAYYCVLLDILDGGPMAGRWWIDGWASRVMQNIMSTLESQWQTWIEWPVQSVVLKQTLAPLDLLL